MIYLIIWVTAYLGILKPMQEPGGTICKRPDRNRKRQIYKPFWSIPRKRKEAYQEALLKAYDEYASSLMEPPYDWESALAPAEKALEIAKERYQSQQSEDAGLMLANCYHRLVTCSMNLQRFEEADKYCYHILILLYDLADKLGAFDNVYHLVVEHITAAQPAKALNDQKKVCMHYQYAAKHMETLLPYNSTPPFLRKAADLYHTYADILKGNDVCNDESIAAFRRSITLYEELYHAKPSKENADALSDAYRGIAAQLDQRGDHIEADTLYKRSFEVLEAFVDPKKQKNLDMIKNMLQSMIDQDKEEMLDDEDS